MKNQFPINLEKLNENNIIAVAVNTYNNMSLLADVPCRSVSEDYSLFYKYRVGDVCNRGTITINDECQIFTLNLPRLAPDPSGSFVFILYCYASFAYNDMS